jgi:hypothetical protein
MKRLLLSLLSTVAVFGAIAPMAQAMPTRLENVRQAHLNDTYLNPRQADVPGQGNSGTGNTVAQRTTLRPQPVRSDPARPS